ncbi:MAG: hypothetical protein VX335_04140 [Pseudomonadota bacterium]|nr:hypothetical protein [Pseudomonadota bacterium]
MFSSLVIKYKDKVISEPKIDISGLIGCNTLIYIKNYSGSYTLLDISKYSGNKINSFDNLIKHILEHNNAININMVESFIYDCEAKSIQHKIFDSEIYDNPHTVSNIFVIEEQEIKYIINGFSINDLAPSLNPRKRIITEEVILDFDEKIKKAVSNLNFDEIQNSVDLARLINETMSEQLIMEVLDDYRYMRFSSSGSLVLDNDKLFLCLTNRIVETTIQITNSTFNKLEKSSEIEKTFFIGSKRNNTRSSSSFSDSATGITTLQNKMNLYDQIDAPSKQVKSSFINDFNRNGFSYKNMNNEIIFVKDNRIKSGVYETLRESKLAIKCRIKKEIESQNSNINDKMLNTFFCGYSPQEYSYILGPKQLPYETVGIKKFHFEFGSDDIKVITFNIGFATKDCVECDELNKAIQDLKTTDFVDLSHYKEINLDSALKSLRIVKDLFSLKLSEKCEKEINLAKLIGSVSLATIKAQDGKLLLSDCMFIAEIGNEFSEKVRNDTIFPLEGLDELVRDRILFDDYILTYDNIPLEYKSNNSNSNFHKFPVAENENSRILNVDFTFNNSLKTLQIHCESDVEANKISKLLFSSENISKYFCSDYAKEPPLYKDNTWLPSEFGLRSFFAVKYLNGGGTNKIIPLITETKTEIYTKSLSLWGTRSSSTLMLSSRSSSFIESLIEKITSDTQRYFITDDQKQRVWDFAALRKLVYEVQRDMQDELQYIIQVIRYLGVEDQENQKINYTRNLLDEMESNIDIDNQIVWHDFLNSNEHLKPEYTQIHNVFTDLLCQSHKDNHPIHYLTKLDINITDCVHSIIMLTKSTELTLKFISVIYNFLSFGLSKDDCDSIIDILSNISNSMINTDLINDCSLNSINVSEQIHVQISSHKVRYTKQHLSTHGIFGDNKKKFGSSPDYVGEICESGMINFNT